MGNRTSKAHRDECEGMERSWNDVDMAGPFRHEQQQQQWLDIDGAEPFGDTQWEAHEREAPLSEETAASVNTHLRTSLSSPPPSSSSWLNAQMGYPVWPTHSTLTSPPSSARPPTVTPLTPQSILDQMLKPELLSRMESRALMDPTAREAYELDNRNQYCETDPVDRLENEVEQRQEDRLEAKWVRWVDGAEAPSVSSLESSPLSFACIGIDEPGAFQNGSPARTTESLGQSETEDIHRLNSPETSDGSGGWRRVVARALIWRAPPPFGSVAGELHGFSRIHEDALRYSQSADIHHTTLVEVLALDELPPLSSSAPASSTKNCGSADCSHDHCSNSNEDWAEHEEVIPDELPPLPLSPFSSSTGSWKIFCKSCGSANHSDLEFGRWSDPKLQFTKSPIKTPILRSCIPSASTFLKHDQLQHDDLRAQLDEFVQNWAQEETEEQERNYRSRSARPWRPFRPRTSYSAAISVSEYSMQSLHCLDTIENQAPQCIDFARPDEERRNSGGEAEDINTDVNGEISHESLAGQGECNGRYPWMFPMIGRHLWL